MGLKDLFIRGFIAGFIANLVKDSLSFISRYLLHFTQITYTDFSSIMIFGNRPSNLYETLFSTFAELFWSGWLGVIFVYLVPLIKTKNFLLKSVGFSLTLWFVLYSVVKLFKVPGLTSFAWQSGVSNFITSSIEGLVMGLVLLGFERRAPMMDWKGNDQKTMIDDRFTRGLLAGLSGGAVLSLLNYVSHYLLHFAKTRYIDFAGMMIFGRFPHNFWEVALAQVALLVFTSCIAILFTLLIPVIRSEYLALKGWIFSAGLWFLVHSMSMLFKIPHFLKVPWQTATSNFITASIFGLVMVWTLRRLEGSRETSREI